MLSLRTGAWVRVARCVSSRTLVPFRSKLDGPGSIALVDFWLYQRLNGLAHSSDRLEDVLQFIALYGEYFFMALLAGLFLARGKWASRNARHGVIAAGLSAALALGVAQVIAGIVDRPRPYVAHPGDSFLY